MAHADWIIDLGPSAGHDGPDRLRRTRQPRRRPLAPSPASTLRPTSAPPPRPDRHDERPVRWSGQGRRHRLPAPAAAATPWTVRRGRAGRGLPRLRRRSGRRRGRPARRGRVCCSAPTWPLSAPEHGDRVAPDGGAPMVSAGAAVQAGHRRGGAGWPSPAAGGWPCRQTSRSPGLGALFGGVLLPAVQARPLVDSGTVRLGSIGASQAMDMILTSWRSTPGRAGLRTGQPCRPSQPRLAAPGSRHRLAAARRSAGGRLRVSCSSPRAWTRRLPSRTGFALAAGPDPRRQSRGPPSSPPGRQPRVVSAPRRRSPGQARNTSSDPLTWPKASSDPGLSGARNS